MKVALVHDWLTGMRGGERVLHGLCELFPDADLFTLLHVPGSVSPLIERRTIVPSFLQYVPFIRKTYRHFLPIFPFAIERFKLNGYDLIVSSSHCVAKGVIGAPGTCHVSYIHTPMRYVWDLYAAYLTSQRAWAVRLAMPLFVRGLRQWDVSSNTRVNYWIANSQYVADRIKRLYRKEAQVVYPPVDVEGMTPSRDHDGYYLMVTALVPYKRVDLAIAACTQLNRSLVIIGAGPDAKALRRAAGSSIRFLGWQPDAVVREHYRRCRALIFPGLEDFGIVPVEAMAAGKPVIAYAAGGALETVVPLYNGRSRQGRPTGIFFSEQTAPALSQAIRMFEDNERAFEPEAIREHANQFSAAQFHTRITRLIGRWYEDFHRGSRC